MLGYKISAALLLTLTLAGCASSQLARNVENADRARAESAKRRSAATDTSTTAAQIPRDTDGGPVSVLTVNGHDVTVDEILAPLRSDLQERVERMPPAEYRDHVVKAVNAQVGSTIRDSLLYQEAAKDITEEEDLFIDGLVDQEIRKLVNAQFAGRQTRFERELADNGSSLGEQRDQVRRRLLIMRWLQQTVYSKITDPTRDELMRIFAGQRDSFTTPPRRDMLIIEIAIEKNSRETARQSADAARAELLAGSDFGAVAGKHSTGWHKEKGGHWGWVTRGSVRERLEPAVDALFALSEAGVPSDIIETPLAFFVVQAAAIDYGKEADFTELQPQLVAKYRDMQFSKMVDGSVRKLQENAHYRPLDPNRFVHACLLAAPVPSSIPRTPGG